MSVTVTLTESETMAMNSQAEVSSYPLYGQENGVEEEEREAELIIFDNTTQGLGLKICGGSSPDGQEVYGIFVKRVLPGGLAEKTGEIQAGDLILEVNGQSMEDITYDRAISMLRQASASNHVEMVITRDLDAREEFADFMTRYGSVQSPAMMTNGSPRSQPQSTTPENDVEYSSKMGTNLKDTNVEEELVRPIEQNDLNRSGDFQLVNGHVSPTSSCASEVASHMEDVKAEDRPLTPEATAEVRSGNDTPSDFLDSMLSRKLSQDPGLKLHIDQLEGALINLGLPFSPSAQNTLRNMVHIDPDGMVRFEEFVQAAKSIFSTDLRAMRNQSMPRKSVEPPVQISGVGREDYASMVRERDLLKEEIERLKEEVKRCNLQNQKAEEQLLFVRKEAQVTIEEGRSLRSKLHLAEQAHAKAQQTERDYEEVVAMLENEVAQLRLELSKSEGVNMQKRLAVLVCQLKKAESGKKTYEVATEKLTRFVEHSMEVLNGSDSSPRKPPGTDNNVKPTRKKTLAALATEGQDVLKTVRSLMETVPLPFGWEEAYTAEGVKYYINHLNQTTTWTHPVTCMEHQTTTTSSYKAPPEPPASTSSPRQLQSARQQQQQQQLSSQQQQESQGQQRQAKQQSQQPPPSLSQQQQQQQSPRRNQQQQQEQKDSPRRNQQQPSPRRNQFEDQKQLSHGPASKNRTTSKLSAQVVA